MLDRALSAQPRELPERDRGDALGRRSQRARPRPGGRRQRPRLPRRLGAPAALAAVVVAIVLVVSADHRGTTKSTPSATVARPRSNHHFWIVRPGQTLSLIVARTGVSLARIEALNPKLNSGALQTGQHILIRP